MAAARQWNDAEDALLLQRASSGLTLDTIAGMHQRSREAVRLHYLELLRAMTPADRTAAKVMRAKNAKRLAENIGSRASTAEIADRDARLSLAHRSLTAAVFGDPLPGRSALDRMQGGC